MFFSCSNTDELLIENDNSELRNYLPTTNASIQGTYHIQVVGGISNDRCLLSAKQDGSGVVLWYKDEIWGREKWQISPYYFNNIFIGYIIKVYGGVNSEKKFLSVTTDGKRVGLYDRIEGPDSFRQIWKINGLPWAAPTMNYCIIETAGNLSSSRKYLSATKNGESICTWYSDDEAGRERWYLKLVGY